MSSRSGPNQVKKLGAPRVHIAYEDPTDAENLVELPFVMGVASDLSGNASKVEKPEMAKRRFVPVNDGTLDDFMSDVAPGLAYSVEDRLSGKEGTKLGVELHFSELEDLNPGRVARQIPSLAKLLAAREHLDELRRYVNTKPAAQKEIKRLLEDPDLLKALASRLPEEAKADDVGDAGT